MPGSDTTPDARGKISAQERGFALLLVLWTLAFMSLIGTQALTLGHASLTLENTVLWRARLQTTADAALTTELFMVATHSHLSDRNWHTGPGYGGIRVEMRSRSSHDLINPNIAGQPLLAALLETQGIPSARSAALSATIFAWRMSADVKAPTLRSGRCTPIGAPMHDLDDLSAIPGFSPDLLTRLAPHLSFSQRQLPDMSTRDPAVRRALIRSQISNGTDQMDQHVEAGDGTLIVLDAIAHKGQFRLQRHAEAVVTLDAQPFPWRIIRWETVTDDPAELD